MSRNSNQGAHEKKYRPTKTTSTKGSDIYNNLGIINKNPTNTELDISISKLVVVVGGKEGGSQQNTTNI